MTDDVFNVPFTEKNDAGAGTVGGYLAKLLTALIEKEEGFSGKRPFGNSGWLWELGKPLVEAGLVPGTLDDEGYLDDLDEDALKAVLVKSIAAEFYGDDS